MSRKKVGNATLFDAALHQNKILHEFDDIYKLIDWDRIEGLLAGIHSARLGGAAYPPLIMFRAMLLQVWHNLSDPQAEKQLYRDLLFRRFCGLSLMDDVPDHSTISRFRGALLRANLYDRLLEEINTQLAAKGGYCEGGGGQHCGCFCDRGAPMSQEAGGWQGEYARSWGGVVSEDSRQRQEGVYLWL